MGESEKRGTEEVDKDFYKSSKKRRMTIDEVREKLYSIFEIYGFFIADNKYLFAFVKYIDHQGNEVYSSRMFMSLIEFIPRPVRVDIYKDMSPYLYDKFVKNPHLMPKDEEELISYMPWKAKTAEILYP